MTDSAPDADDPYSDEPSTPDGEGGPPAAILTPPTPLHCQAEPPTHNQAFRVSESEKVHIDQLKLRYGMAIGRPVDTRDLLLVALAMLAEEIGWQPN